MCLKLLHILQIVNLTHRGKFIKIGVSYAGINEKCTGVICPKFIKKHIHLNTFGASFSAHALEKEI